MTETALKSKAKSNIASNSKTDSTIVKSDYWLNNLETPMGGLSINLVTGLKGSTGKTMQSYLDLLAKHGLVKVNKWLESKGSNLYIVKEGESANTIDIDSLDAEFAALD